LKDRRDILRTRLLTSAGEAFRITTSPCSSSTIVSPASFQQALNSPHAVASLIDHTLLKPEAAERDIVLLCKEAREFAFASVCINPYWVALAADQLSGSSVRVCTVVGFPLGANHSRTKLAEADIALSEGATELDMVQNIGALRSHALDAVQEDIAQIARLAHSRGALLKVILETCLLSEEEKITSCRLASEASADFVKTSTGFSAAGATVADVQLMRQYAGPSVGVKASGGVRTLDALRQMVGAGANRIGTSSGVAILRELQADSPGASSSNVSENAKSGASGY
jgi:deoxyribose-phosphate aldolase